MKSERRHELKESDLAHAIETGKGYLSGHGKRVGIMLLAFIVVIVGTNVVMSSRASDATDRWRKLSLLAFDSPDVARESFATMLALANDAGHGTLQMQTLLNRGSRALVEAGKDENPNLEFNQIARESFELLLKRFPQNPIAKGSGHLGLATCEENDFAADGSQTRKATALSHLSAILDDSTLHTMPVYQFALARRAKLDDVFTSIVFAPPLEPEPEATKNTPLPSNTGTVEAVPGKFVPIPAPPTTAPEKEGAEQEEGTKPDGGS